MTRYFDGINKETGTNIRNHKHAHDSLLLLHIYFPKIIFALPKSQSS